MAEVYLSSKFQITATAKMVPMGEVGGARLGIHSSRPAAIPATDGQRRGGLQVAPIKQNFVIRQWLDVHAQYMARGKHQAYFRTQAIVAQVLRSKMWYICMGKVC